MSNGRTGRRKGNPDTRAQILDAARDAFAEVGFDRATIREIARRADVDPALVHHYFGSKDKLLLATIDAPFDPGKVLPGIIGPGLDGVGERLVRAFVGVWDGPAGARGSVLLRSALSHPLMLRLLREFLISRILRVAVRELGVEIDHAPFRGSLVASQLLGLALTRYILKVEPMVDAPPEAVVAMVGPTIQRYIEGPLPDSAP
ncbi:TetR family transcriptional regulator [Actinorhabdospora filicis]|uniref:TetR family transcriptional regulator n=1 Tax=Actinorhabdospora filicis TaxID=1785913 RepID=A0A9W6SH59_9ACTN|nr:TetR family transcriptional regulator [Actinorhabdospora filicis]GLZ75339.1 TetR family transcriptional regulator [Actinorhabdospora filicis]